MMYKNMNLPTVDESKLSYVENVLKMTDSEGTLADQIRGLWTQKISHGDTCKLLDVSNPHVRNTLIPWCKKHGYTYDSYSPNKKGTSKDVAALDKLFGAGVTAAVSTSIDEVDPLDQI